MCPPLDVDAAIAALARRQWGVVARRQLDDVGATGAAVRHLLARRRLLPLHRGVYAVGHDRLTVHGRWLAAVLAVPPPAALSHRDAAALHGLRSAGRPAIDVTTTSRRAADRPGVEVHRTTVLTAQDATAVAGVPVTTVARTLVDLAGVVPPAQLRRALDEAELRRTFDLAAIEAALERTRGRHGGGHARLRAALADLARAGAQLTRSALEERFLALVADHGLPRPRPNAWVDGHEVDAWWSDGRVAVELDGWAFHRGRAAFGRDRAKGNALALGGVTVLRFTHADVVQRPAAVAAQLRRALGS